MTQRPRYNFLRYDKFFPFQADENMPIINLMAVTHVVPAKAKIYGGVNPSTKPSIRFHLIGGTELYWLYATDRDRDVALNSLL